MKIACVGGGPAGLYLSILLKLRDPAHEVTVYERSKANSTSGWGVTFRRTLLAELYAQDPESAGSLEAAAFCWRDQVIHIRGEQVVAPGGDAYNISRRRLIEILTDRAAGLGVRIEYGTEILSPAQLPAADLVVAADGVNSKLHAALGDGSSATVTMGENKYIWLGSDRVFDSFNFLFTETEHGWVWAYAYGIDAESSTFIVECSAQTWGRLGFDAMSTDRALSVLEQLFKRHIDGGRLIGKLGDGSMARWENFRTNNNRVWHSGKVVLIGDAAHTAHFSIGMGTTLAIQDAIRLADALHVQPDLESALESYERQRKSDLVPVLAEAHCSARWFENLGRYIDLEPRKFGVLLYARCSPLTAVLPPRISHMLRSATKKVRVLDAVRDSVAPTVKAIYSLSRRPHRYAP